MRVVPYLIASILITQVTAASNFIYTSAGDFEALTYLLNRQDIAGFQIVYNWNQLETSQGHYDFSKIEKHLALLNSKKKNLFIQVQDRFFSPEAKNIPKYLLKDPAYGGGLVPQTDNPGEGKPKVQGWVAQQWNPAVQRRYQALLQALALYFDGRVYGINLPESAIDINMKADKSGFTCDRYFQAEVENIASARKVFKQAFVVQYVNFWPCEWNNNHHYMSRMFDFAVKNNIGLGGPDLIPNKKSQIDNSYPFFSKYKGKLSLVLMAIQEPTLTYKNPNTGKPFTKAEFESFGRSYLGASIIAWTAYAPWLSPSARAGHSR